MSRTKTKAARGGECRPRPLCEGRFYGAWQISRGSNFTTFLRRETEVKESVKSSDGVGDLARQGRHRNCL